MQFTDNSTFINIHTHKKNEKSEEIALLNRFPEQIEDTDNKKRISAGIHPWYIDDDADAQVQKLKKISKEKYIFTVGEIGLDRVCKTEWQKQMDCFEEQLKIAESHNKPVIIHCVKAYSDILSVRKQYNKTAWIVHGFNENRQIAGQLIKHNCYLSFGEILFTENSKAVSVFKEIEMTDFFLETDESAYSIDYVYKKAASLKQIRIETLKKQLIKNFNTCFSFLYDD